MIDSIDAAYMLGVSTGKVYALAKRGEIPHARCGRRLQFDPIELRRWRREWKKMQAPRGVPSTSSDFTPEQIAGLPDTGWVYFFQAIDGGAIKIGKADAPLRRLAATQAHSPVRLRMLGTLPGGKRREYELHRRFKASRLHGEWFEPTPELLAEIVAAGRGHRGTV